MIHLALVTNWKEIRGELKAPVHFWTNQRGRQVAISVCQKILLRKVVLLAAVLPVLKTRLGDGL